MALKRSLGDAFGSEEGTVDSCPEVDVMEPERKRPCPGEQRCMATACSFLSAACEHSREALSERGHAGEVVKKLLVCHSALRAAGEVGGLPPPVAAATAKVLGMIEFVCDTVSREFCQPDTAPPRLATALAEEMQLESVSSQVSEAIEEAECPEARRFLSQHVVLLAFLCGASGRTVQECGQDEGLRTLLRPLGFQGGEVDAPRDVIALCTARGAVQLAEEALEEVVSEWELPIAEDEGSGDTVAASSSWEEDVSDEDEGEEDEDEDASDGEEEYVDESESDDTSGEEDSDVLLGG